MKCFKGIFIIICLFFSFQGEAFTQGVAVVVDQPNVKRMYVGSLPKSTQCFQKLKIEVFGGNWGHSNIGIKTYVASTRDGLSVNEEVHMGAVSDRYVLRIYEVNSKYDFVIETTGSWTSILIQSWMLDGIKNGVKTVSPINIVEYDVDNKENVTSQFSFNSFFATDAFGNIGIGTENPKAKLDVRGKIMAEEVEIKINSGADFVFEPTYNLSSLSEIEAFIKENKHLPGIQSENKMKEEGITVNEMQIKLLQKIEELTLYIIDHDKKMKVLEQRLDKYENQK